MSAVGAGAILAVAIAAGVVVASARPSVSHDIADSGYAQVELGRVEAQTIDRTFRCVPLALGGLRSVTLHVVPRGTREQYLQAPSPGFAGVSAETWGPDSELVSIRARGWQRFRTTHSAPGVYASTRRCASSPRSVALSARGLPGPPVRWEERTTCLTGGRVLMRVRAVLRSNAPWRQADDSYIGARSSVVEAALAVRSERTGKPIAYVKLGRSGKTTSWYSSDCT